jgi:hypothetical protein
MFGMKRRVTIEEFARELVRFSIHPLSMPYVEQAKLWNASIEYGADPSTSLYEFVFLRGVSVWHALFTAKSRGKLRDAEWSALNGEFLACMMEELSKYPREDNPWKAYLSEVFEHRLRDYRDSTAGADAVSGIKAMSTLFAKFCSVNSSNQRLIGEGFTILTVGTNKLIDDVISKVKFIG